MSLAGHLLAIVLAGYALLGLSNPGRYGSLANGATSKLFAALLGEANRPNPLEVVSDAGSGFWHARDSRNRLVDSTPPARTYAHLPTKQLVLHSLVHLGHTRRDHFTHQPLIRGSPRWYADHVRVRRVCGILLRSTKRVVNEANLMTLRDDIADTEFRQPTIGPAFDPRNFPCGGNLLRLLGP